MDYFRNKNGVQDVSQSLGYDFQFYDPNNPPKAEEFEKTNVIAPSIWQSLKDGANNNYKVAIQNFINNPDTKAANAYVIASLGVADLMGQAAGTSILLNKMPWVRPLLETGKEYEQQAFLIGNTAQEVANFDKMVTQLRATPSSIDKWFIVAGHVFNGTSGIKLQFQREVMQEAPGIFAFTVSKPLGITIAAIQEGLENFGEPTLREFNTQLNIAIVS